MLRVSERSKIVNPTEPVWLEGGATRKGKAIGVYNNIKVMALYLEVNSKKMVLCTLDAIALSYKDVEDLKGRITDRVDILKNNIIIVTTHTHSAPAVRFTEEKLFENANHKEFMFNSLVDIAQEACETPEEVTAHYRTGEVFGFYGYRDHKDKDGDQQVNLITFDNKVNETVAAIVNIHVHPTFLDQNFLLVSSDMAGVLRKHLTKPIGVEPVFICGVTGDMSSRYYRKSQTYFELERSGQAIAKEIMKFNKKELHLNALEFRTVEYTVDREIKLSDYQDKLESYLRQKEEETNPTELRLLETKIKKAKAVLDKNEPKIHAEYVTSIVNLGDLEIVTFNSDPVVLFGKMIKNAITKGKLCITISHANGEEGYLVEKQDFNTGYIGNVTKALPGQAEEYIKKIIDNLFV